MELKDKLDYFETVLSVAATGPAALRDEAILALTSLGMSRNVAERALEDIDWTAEDSESLETVIKKALRHASHVG